jgi:hypothetical protein
VNLKRAVFWCCRSTIEVEGTGRKKKRKKQKIQAEKGTGSLARGSKTVFDASGRALDSLEVLQSAREVCNRSLAHRVLFPVGEDQVTCTIVCHCLSVSVLFQAPDFQTADERFSARRLWVKEQDQEDRQVDKQKRRERRLQKKMKKKEQAAAEAQGHGAAILGGDLDSEHSRGSEEEEGITSPIHVRKARRATGAYKGMMDDTSPEASSPVRAVKDLRIREQEQLALQLLGHSM